MRAALVAAIWLLPVFWAGTTTGVIPGAPRIWTYFQRLSCLFTRRADTWEAFYVEFREGSEWHAVAFDQFSHMTLFGVRTRLEWVLEDMAFDDDRPIEQQAELAAWLARRRAAANPSSLPPDGVRFTMVRLPLDNGRPRLRWSPPSLADVAPEDRIVLSEHSVSVLSSGGVRAR